MIRKNLSLVLLAIVVALAGTACKKDSPDSADNKSYLVDPNSGTTPPGSKPGPGTDPCLKKGAIGVQALLTKTDCANLGTPKCGDGNPEGNEACDEGSKNGLAGSKCSIDCKKVVDKKEGGDNGGNTNDKVLKITTESMPDKNLGDTYSASIKVSGGKNSKDYKWTVSNLPEGFESSASNDSVKISSKGILTKTGTYKPSVQVCLVSNPADCATCSESVCSFSVKDGVTLTASRSTSSKTICDSSDGGHCALTVAPTENIFGFVNANGPKFLLVLYVSNYSKTDKDFQWKLSVKDGNASKEIPVVKATEQLQCNPMISPNGELAPSCNGKPVSFPTGLFLMEPKHYDKDDDVGDNAGKGSYHKHYLMFGLDAYGKTYEGVEIFVKNNITGGEQKIVFNKIVLPTLSDFNQKKDEKNPCYGKNGLLIPKLTINGQIVEPINKENVPVKSGVVNYKVDAVYGEEVEGTVHVVGGVAPYETKLIYNWVDMGKYTHTLDNEWELKAGENADTLKLTGGLNYSPTPNLNTGKIYDGFQYNITDQCGNEMALMVEVKVGAPKTTGKISDLKLLADFRTEWTDGDSKIKFEIYNSAGQLLAYTAEESVDGGDPTCFNKYFKLTVKPEHENDSIDTISKVKLGGVDNGNIDMTLYFKFLRLDVKDGNGSTVLYATAPGDFDHGDYNNNGSWEFDDITVFTKNPSNGSIWFYGEPPHHADEGGGGSCDEWKH